MPGRVLALACALVVTAGCGALDSLFGPSSLSIDGTYTGSFVDSEAGAGTVQVTFSSDGASLSGTWVTTFPDPANNSSGTLTGTFTDTTLAAVLTPSSPGACALSVVATRTATQISGTYSGVNCSESFSGTINLTKP
jgi:hypothetical protein